MPACAVIGAGLIGRAWAMVFARAGWNVAITDTSELARSAALGLIEEALADQARHGLVDDAKAALARIKVAATLAKLRAASISCRNAGQRRSMPKLRCSANSM